MNIERFEKASFAVIGKKGNRSTIYSSLLGNKFYRMEKREKEDLKKRLLLRIPIIQNIFVHESIGQIDKDMNILSPATEKRSFLYNPNIRNFRKGG